ncbi:MAG: DinB family protein [Vicinamibacterales bacterium]
MSLAKQALAELNSAQEFFNRSTRNLQEEHSGFAPAAGMMTAAQQVAHAAQTVDWFMQGAFRPEGFDMDFEQMARDVAACSSLASARAWFERAMKAARDAVGAKSDAELTERLPEGPIMGGAPRMAIFGAITDHTAHHRGALTVYARLQGIVPPMPYMDM